MFSRTPSIIIFIQIFLNIQRQGPTLLSLIYFPLERVQLQYNPKQDKVEKENFNVNSIKFENGLFELLFLFSISKKNIGYSKYRLTRFRTIDSILVREREQLHLSTNVSVGSL